LPTPPVWRPAPPISVVPPWRPWPYYDAFGNPYYPPRYYPYAPYYPAPVQVIPAPVYGTTVIVPPAQVSPLPPMQWIEQPSEPAAPLAGYWYWCADPQGWHPQVQDCPSGFVPVAPNAEGQQP
jgi:hypothetical protein